MKSKALLIGDSLTAGLPGASYVVRLRRAYPAFEWLAAGRGGETVLGAARRVEVLLQEARLPDLLVFALGVNDLLLPYLAGRGGLWTAWVRRKEGLGCLPAQAHDLFRARYSHMIEGARRAGVAKVILTTLTCLGEDLSSPLNGQREGHNREIRALAVESGAALADVGAQFDLVLRQGRSPGRYLLGSIPAGLLDALSTRWERAADSLSRRRGLSLTIDGIHLNRQGAALFAGVLGEAVTHL